MTAFVGRLGLFTAGPAFALGLALMQPQMTRLADLDGPGSFIHSLTLEPQSWALGHLVLLAAGLAYILAGFGVTEAFGDRRPVTGRILGLLITLGGALLIGNFALDFVYGALANGLEPQAADAARHALMDDPLVASILVNGAGMAMLSGMALLSVTVLVTGWLPRLAAAAILAGWAFVFTLHGQFAYAEAIGHFIIGSGFILIGLATFKPRSQA